MQEVIDVAVVVGACVVVCVLLVVRVVVGATVSVFVDVAVAAVVVRDVVVGGGSVDDAVVVRVAVGVVVGQSVNLVMCPSLGLKNLPQSPLASCAVVYLNRRHSPSLMV